MSVQVKTELDRNTTVFTKMSKREAAELVRFLTHEIAEAEGYLIDIRFDIREDYDRSIVRVSPANNTLFGSVAMIDSVLTAENK